MISTNETEIVKDSSGKKLIVTRHFNALPERVWRAWTESNLLDDWWAPKPYKAETKTMNFQEGGLWLYAMVSPDGDKNWCRMDYHIIEPQTSFTAVDMFCDENGNKAGNLPSMHWYIKFISTDTGTNVTVEVTFDSEADLEKIVELGFKEGFTMAHGNLDKLLTLFKG